MKKTFTRDTIVKVPNEELYKFMLSYAVSSGVPKFKDTGNFYKIYPNITFDGRELCGNCHNCDFVKYTLISIEQFFEYCDNWKEAQPIKIQLNNSYSAEISQSEKTVTVGCQTFPFSKITELYNAIQTP